MVAVCPDCGYGMQIEKGDAYRCENCNYLSEPVPSVETMQEWMNDGGCETPCGCWVEPDGCCTHGNHSWMILQGMI